MAEENIFGIPDEPAEIVEETEEAITSEVPEVEAPAEGSPAEEVAPEAEQVPAVAPDEEVAQDVQQPIEGEEIDPLQAWYDQMPEGTQFAGKFDSTEALEKGYNESREMWRRANEARKAEAQRAMQLQEQYAQLYGQLEGVVPVLEQAAQRERAYQAFSEKYREQYGNYPEGYQPPASPAAIGPQDVNAIVEQRLGQERQAMQAQFAAQQEYQQLEGAIMGFYSDHPEVEPNGALDSEITDVRDVLNDSWDRYGIEVDPSDRGSLEILYEAAQDPALTEVLKLNPQYFESAYGMDLARRDAAVISGKVPATTQATTKVAPSSQLKATGERKPFTESAAVGTTAPEGEDESDPWVRIKNSGPTPSGGGDGSIFFE